MKIEASGVNFIDVYQREGRYKVPLPFVPGQEAAGVIAALGPEVTGFKVGDRVAWCHVLGAYAEYAAVPVAMLIAIPEGVTVQQAAASMLQGMTAHYLSHSTYAIKAGDAVLIHAGAGGVGLLLIQMAKRLGARVLTTVSTDAKAELARAAGADEAILYTQRGFCGADAGADRRRGRAGGVRLGGQDDVRRQPGVPAAARVDGAVWRVERGGAAVRSDPTFGEGVAVCDAADAEGLHPRAGGAGAARGRGAGVGGGRQPEAAD